MENEELKYHYKYPHPSVTTDCVIFGFDGEGMKVLLIQRGGEPHKGKWAFPGGFLNIDESAEEGALRELEEETGLKNAYIRQFHAFSAPDRDPRERVITIAYYALVRIQEVKGADDAADARWYSLDEIPPLAFDHDEMLKTALREMRKQLYFEPIGLGLLSENFTAEEVTKLYESAIGHKIDKQHLCEGLAEYGLIETSCDDADRGCMLFRFNKEKYEELSHNGCLLDFIRPLTR